MTHITRKSLPDKSELSRSTATEGTTATTGSLSERSIPVARTDITEEDADVHVVEVATGLERDVANLISKPKPILKCKTVEESLAIEYESSRRRQLRLKRDELRKKRSLRRNMNRTLSRMSKRSLFESDVDNGADSVWDNVRIPSASSQDNVLGSSRGRQWSKSHSYIGTVTISEPTDGVQVLQTPNPEISTLDRRATFGKAKSLPVHDAPNQSTDRSRNRANSKRGLFSESKSKSKTFSSGSLSSLFFFGSKSVLERGSDDHTTAISWDWVEIREYAPELGANPCVSRGPAVSLSWSYVVTDRLKFEEYENLRPPRREMNEMRLPAKEREERLLASGVTQKEIQAAIENISEARKKRMKTVEQLNHLSMHERLEGAKKKLLKIVGKRKSHKKEEEDLWENAQCYFAASV